MSGSLIRGDRENGPGIPGACATRNCTYLERGPWTMPSCLPDPSLWCILSTGRYPPSVKSYIKRHGRPNPGDWLPPRQAHLCNLRSGLSCRWKSWHNPAKSTQHTNVSLFFQKPTGALLLNNVYIPYPLTKHNQQRELIELLVRIPFLLNVSIQQPWGIWKKSTAQRNTHHTHMLCDGLYSSTSK